MRERLLPGSGYTVYVHLVRQNTIEETKNTLPGKKDVLAFK